MGRASRRTRALLFGVLLALAGTTASAETTLIPTQAVWKFDATGTDLGSGWRDPAYDDSSWAEGAGILGYGEAYITTLVPFGPDPGDKYPTTYFRHTFTHTPNPSEPSLIVRVNYDDGLVMYLNGIEVLRRGFAAGDPVPYESYATSHEGGNYETVVLTPHAGLLVSGANVLAVELHQTSPGSSDLVWDAELVTGVPVLTRGPYLQSAEPNSLVIRWRTDAPTESWVGYGPAPGQWMSSQVDVTATTEHEILLSGLVPNTQYYYAVGTSGLELAGGTSDYTFITPPVPGAVQPTRVWVIGDSGTANQNAAAVRNAYLMYTGNRRTDVWLMLGDNAYNAGTDAQYQAAVFDMYPGILRNTFLWPTRGNHDLLYAGVDNDYYDIFTLPTSGVVCGLPSGTEAYYSFDYANTHFVCMDSEGSDRSPEGDMLCWLQNDLASTAQDWIIAFWHHPPYTKGSHDSDNPSDSGGRMRDMRENALPVLEAGGVDLVLTGHSHSYERSFLLDGHYGTSGTLDSTMIVDSGNGHPMGDGAYRKSPGLASHEGSVYVVAGSSGLTSGGALNHPVMMTSLNELGSLVLDIHGFRLEAAFLDASKTVRDAFSIHKATATGPPPAPPARGLVLATARPNPFRDRTRMEFALPRAGEVRVRVFDIEGRRIATLVSGHRPAGDHVATWTGRDAAGRAVAAGTYFAVLEFEGEIRAQKVLLRP